MSVRSFLAGALFAAALSESSPCRADTSALQLGEALAQLPDGGARFLALSGTKDAKSTPLLVHVESNADALRLGLLPVTSHLAIGWPTPSQWSALASDPAVSGLSFSPPRLPLMDVAGPWVSADRAWEDYGLQGEGSIIGVVDTGFDATHPAFRSPNGTSRVSWLLAFEQSPRGVHPELEERYGCTGADPCAVYSREDIDGILSGNSSENLPLDRVGHGTHLTSIAGGTDPRYTGIAPLADLIVVAASDPSGAVTDARILIGTRFVFDRAEEEGKPAVVNLSLGSSFGAHDGSSSIEEGLAELGRGAGRAVVVAAGNDGELQSDLSDDYPGPFGIHTEVAVPTKTTIRVPLISSVGVSTQTQGAIFIWISTRPNDKISVGFHNGRGAESPLVGMKNTLAFNSKGIKDEDDYDVIILNGVDDELGSEIQPGSVIVALSGSWQSGRVFELVLEGSATARMWVTGAGAAGPAGGGRGPVFPRARISGTVAVPASEKSLITVGATANRSSWMDYTGAIVGYPTVEDGRASFSSAGPSQLGDLKPELVAPGGSVIAAMSQAADPRGSSNPFTIFASGGSCPGSDECYVIDDEHGISSGTSMAAPMVAGAVALLMQREPTLTMEEAKHLLMAGSEDLGDAGIGSLVGTGELNIVGALLAQERALSGDSPRLDPAGSRLAWADRFVRPATASPLMGYLLLRDEDGFATDDGSDDVDITVSGPGRAERRKVGTGLWELELHADEGSGAQQLVVRVKVRGKLVEKNTVPIALDPILAAHGFEFVGGSCALLSGPAQKSEVPLAFLLMALLACRRRRSQVR